MSDEEFEDEPMPGADEWEEFRYDDTDPIGIEELKRLDLRHLPEDVVVRVMDNYFPDTAIRREGEILLCEIEEHLYTKYWEHKFSAYAFAEAMERAVRRLAQERSPARKSIARCRRCSYLRALGAEAATRNQTGRRCGIDQGSVRPCLQARGFNS